MQKNLILLAFSIVVVSIFTPIRCYDYGSFETQKRRTLECAGETTKRPDELLEVRAKCTNPECHDACLYEDILKIVVNGKLDNDLMMKWIDKVYPDFVVEEAKEEWGKCLKQIKEKLSKDDNCKSYKRVKQCEELVTLKICFL